MLSQSVLRAKLSSVMKKRLMPCARLRRTIRSTSSAERRRDLRPCTLMMVQNEHRNGQPRPASKLVMRPPVRLMRDAGSIGSVRPGQRRQIVHVVVERLECALPGVAQHLVEAALGLAGEQRDAEIHRFLAVRASAPAASRGSPRRESRRGRPGRPRRERCARCPWRAGT